MRLKEIHLTEVVRSIETQKSIETKMLYPDTILIFKSIDTNTFALPQT